LTWLGLWLSLNLFPAPHASPAVELTAIAQARWLTFTTVYVQPLRADEVPVLSVGVGVKLF